MASDDMPCNFLAPTVIEASTPAGNGLARLLRSAVPIYRQVRGLLSSAPVAPAEARPVRAVPERPDLDLEPGDWVEVRPIEEIAETLDGNQRYKGLLFMPAMADYCGRRMRVFKRVKTIRLEDTGEMRQLKSPTVFLEGSVCDGGRSQGCDRACFHFWREAWLQRVPDQDGRGESSPGA